MYGWKRPPVGTVYVMTALLSMSTQLLLCVICLQLPLVDHLVSPGTERERTHSMAGFFLYQLLNRPDVKLCTVREQLHRWTVACSS
jgi:hypothetical protein